MKLNLRNIGALLFLTATLNAVAATPSSLQDAVILVVRHAEKPPSGPELTPEGVQRSQAYVKYFENFQLDGKPFTLDRLIATADSKGSHRPRLTLTPLSRALKMPLDTRFKDKEFQKLADDLQSNPRGKHILVCWHHGAIPDLLQALGADPAQLLPGGKWPPTVFGWVIVLRYDHDGRLTPAQCQRINEHLMPDDSSPTALAP